MAKRTYSIGSEANESSTQKTTPKKLRTSKDIASEIADKGSDYILALANSINQTNSPDKKSNFIKKESTHTTQNEDESTQEAKTISSSEASLERTKIDKKDYVPSNTNSYVGEISVQELNCALEIANNGVDYILALANSMSHKDSENATKVFKDDNEYKAVSDILKKQEGNSWRSMLIREQQIDEALRAAEIEESLPTLPPMPSKSMMR